jgi:uncharacterized protein YndB with AHSA1/START domain
MNNNIIKEVTITRILNAPRELVFKAWTDPKQVAKWWGPHGFTNPVCEVDAKKGGELHICMDSPEFPNHWVHGVFTEVIEPETLSFTTTAFIDEAGNARLEGFNKITFEEDNGKTKMTLHAILTKLAPGLEAAAEGMEEGWSQSFERLASIL